jgi:hypothetical protein
MSELGPAYVKTCASRECAELFSPFSSFDCDCQCCSFPIQRNRDKLSTRKFDVGVFTQAGSKAELAPLERHFRFCPTIGGPSTALASIPTCPGYFASRAARYPSVILRRQLRPLN